MANAMQVWATVWEQANFTICDIIHMKNATGTLRAVNPTWQLNTQNKALWEMSNLLLSHSSQKNC